MATVFIASGPKEGSWFPLQDKTMVFGRDEGLPGQIVAAGVSRKHLQIRFEAKTKTYWAIDMNSTNGVYLNDQPMTKETQLKNDDLIRLGEALLLFSVGDFADGENALTFYRQRGQRDKATQEHRIKDMTENSDR